MVRKYQALSISGERFFVPVNEISDEKSKPLFIQRVEHLFAAVVDEVGGLTGFWRRLIIHI